MIYYRIPHKLLNQFIDDWLNAGPTSKFVVYFFDRFGLILDEHSLMIGFESEEELLEFKLMHL